MKIPAEKILEKAEDCLLDTDIVFDNDRFGATVNQSADYDFEMEITRQDAESAISHAREFLTATKKYFNLK